MARQSARAARDLYHVSGWSDGFFDVNDEGRLVATPLGPGSPAIDLLQVTEALQQQGIAPPVVVRFPQMLAGRVERLNAAFATALRDNECGDTQYQGVFPVKVNQHKVVVQTLAKAGRKWRYGLEVGSKAELLAALTMDPSRRSLLVVNGFKDSSYLDAACQATAFKDTAIIVIDEIGELPQVLPRLDVPNPPKLGLRLKLRAKAPGKWALSGGMGSKFGLTIPEVLHAIEVLTKAGHLDKLVMLHYHIGSQISDIRRIADGTREAARMHAELVRLGVPLQYLDVGGGLAVDYDGSGSSGPNSANYTMEEYANTIVATVKEVCDAAAINVPNLISESGRSVVAHHAALVVNVLRRVPGIALPVVGPPEADDPVQLQNLYALRESLTAKTVFEAFHDAIAHRDDLHSLFDLGHLDLPRLGRSEALFRDVLHRVRSLLEQEDEREAEEYEHATRLLRQKLVGNFSVFQSMPDAWGVKQQFPVLPIHRLREVPRETATLADITCDSDGELRRFIHHQATAPDLPVHSLRRGEPYYLAAMLVGAYQDSLGDYHNLFGETDEAWVEADDSAPGGWRVTKTVQGSKVSDMLAWVRYERADLRDRIRRRVKRLAAAGRLTKDEAARVQATYLDLLEARTYLDLDNSS